MKRRGAVAITSALAGVLAGVIVLAGVALAEDGGVMQRLMGRYPYAGMVAQMSGVLGTERANQMLANCEAAMASAGMSDEGSMQRTISGVGSMMGSR